MEFIKGAYVYGPNNKKAKNQRDKLGVEINDDCLLMSGKIRTNSTQLTPLAEQNKKEFPKNFNSKPFFPSQDLLINWSNLMFFIHFLVELLGGIALNFFEVRRIKQWFYFYLISIEWPFNISLVSVRYCCCKCVYVKLNII